VDIFLCLAETSETKIFDHPVVQGLVQYTWWQAPNAHDILNRCLNFTVLALLSIGISNPMGDGQEDGWLALIMAWVERRWFGLGLPALGIVRRATNADIYIMACEVLVANTIVAFIMEIIELLAYIYIDTEREKEVNKVLRSQTSAMLHDNILREFGQAATDFKERLLGRDQRAEGRDEGKFWSLTTNGDNLWRDILPGSSRTSTY
jgi:hypothetical protein